MFKKTCKQNISTSKRFPIFRHIPIVLTTLVVILAVAVLVIQSCGLRLRNLSAAPIVDPEATPETKALFLNLWTLARSNYTLFGHQDDLAYGVGWRAEPGRSDVFEALEYLDPPRSAGSYPAVYGFEVGHIELGDENNLDGVDFDDIRNRILEGYHRGGVITISWHMDNPVTGGNVYDTGDPDDPDTWAVPRILPGGSHHLLYVNWLNRFADFMFSLRSGPTPWNPEEHLVPVIFRPFHEHQRPGGVFWWSLAAEWQFIELWRFTVNYLRDSRELHNLLYAFSPDARILRGRDFYTGLFPDSIAFNNAYLYGYPGDRYVDIFGMDNYDDPGRGRQAAFEQSMYYLTELANNRSDLKIPAMTETGLLGISYRGVPDDDWWTTFLARSIFGAHTTHGQPAYALVWSNGDDEHFYAPYRGQSSAEDFKKFRDNHHILFEDELPYSLYEWPH